MKMKSKIIFINLQIVEVRKWVISKKKLQLISLPLLAYYIDKLLNVHIIDKDRKMHMVNYLGDYNFIDDLSKYCNNSCQFYINDSFSEYGQKIFVIISDEKEKKTTLLRYSKNGDFEKCIYISPHTKKILIDSKLNTYSFKITSSETNSSEEKLLFIYKFNEDGKKILKTDGYNIKIKDIFINEGINVIIDKHNNFYLWFYEPQYRLFKFNSDCEFIKKISKEEKINSKEERIIDRLLTKGYIPCPSIGQVFFDPKNDLLLVTKYKCCNPIDVWSKDEHVQSIFIKGLGRNIQKMWFDDEGYLYLSKGSSFLYRFLPRFLSGWEKITKARIDLSNLKI